jgi:FkbM family methyltransferase
MDILTRRIVWRNPFSVERVPAVGRLHRAAYAPSARLRRELPKIPLRRVFAAAYALGLGGRGALRLRVKGEDKLLDFDGRNLQFSSLYMPQHAHGYEPETAAVLDAVIGPKDVFYDVGSNWGYFSLFIAARDGFAGKAYAFEPAPGVFRDLAGLVAQAGLGERIDCRNVALSDRGGDGRLSLPDGLHSGLATVSAAGGAPISLKRLDDLGLEPPHVIKMDVEDHEVEALTGGRETLAKAKPYIVFESSVERRVETKMAPFELLAGMGYEFYHPAWRVESGGSARYVPTAELADGASAVLALVPFDPAQRLLLRPQLNVFAGHRDRRGDLKSRFESAAA